MNSPRLDMILNNISSAAVADIGTDHAYIPVELAKRGVTVFATDVNIGPLKIAEKNIGKNTLPITLLHGDGLSPVPLGAAEEIIIAGMGGELISRIISNDFEKAYSAKLLLQDTLPRVAAFCKSRAEVSANSTVCISAGKVL